MRYLDQLKILLHIIAINDKEERNVADTSLGSGIRQTHTRAG